MGSPMKPVMVMATTNDQWQDQRMQRWCCTLLDCGWKVHWIGVDRQRPVALRSDKIICYQRLRVFPGTGPLFYMVFNLRLFARALTVPANAFLAVDADTLPALRLASLIRGKSLWFDAHEWFTEVPELLNRPVTRWCWQLIIRLFIRGRIRCFTVGHELAKRLEQQWGQPFDVLRNMPSVKGPEHCADHTKSIQADITPESMIQGLRGPYLLYQGALNMGRGLEALIEAAALGLPYPLVMAGSGDLQTELARVVLQRKLEGKVFLTGPLSPQHLLHLTRQAFLGFNLLETQSLSYRYSLANKFFDYVKAGVPQICIDFPEYRHHMHLHRVGWLIGTTDPSTIVQYCHRIAQEPEDYKSIRENCHKAAAQWTWEQESSSVQRKLAELCSAVQPSNT
jgi:glycosyltransferase involved in cell wall biosynthesis